MYTHFKKHLFLPLLLFLLTGGAAGAVAPANADLRQGKLPNGLTYYLLRDKGMPGRASYYVYQNVGAVLEDERQNGLAHLLEHLAFNTTRHFPQGVMNFLRGQGLHDFEAYTGKDETYYAVHAVPTGDNSLNQKMTDLLHDWCHGLNFTAKDVEKERGIVVEEWRQRNDVHRRLSDATAPALYHGSRYAERNVIGTEQSIKRFTAADAQRFYDTWYRPELQFVAIVGDIDLAVFEQHLHDRLSSLKSVPVPSVDTQRRIADNATPILLRFVDRENKTPSFGIYQRLPAADQNDREAAQLDLLCTRFFNRLAPRRFATLRNEGKEHFIAATVSLSPLARHYRQLAWDVVPYAGKNDSALVQVLTVREQLHRQGFTADEFAEVKQSIYTDLRGLLDSEALGTPDNFFETFKLNFLYGEPLIGLREQLTQSLEHLVDLEVTDLNRWLSRWAGDNNLSFITYSQTPEEVRLSLTDLQTALATARREAASALVPPAPIKQLIDFPLVPGKIVAVQALPQLEAQEWTLSNGARVYYKYLPDARRTYFAGTAPGGRSAVVPADLPAYTAMRALIMQSGVHTYNRNQLYQWAKGKDFELTLSPEDLTDGIGGNMSLAEAEHFFAYLHLVVAKQNFAPSVFDKYVQRNLHIARTRSVVGMDAVKDSIQHLLFPPSSRNPRTDEAFYAAMRRADVERLFAAHIGDARRFTFCLVGNLPEPEARRLVERYVASLPARPVSAVGAPAPQSLDFSSSAPTIVKEFEADIEGDVGEIELSYAAAIDLSEREQAALEVFRGILEQQLFTELREKRQGTYSVGVQTSYDASPSPAARLSIHFTTERERADSLKAVTYALVKRVAQGGFSLDEFKAVQVPLAVAPAPSDTELPAELLWMGMLNIYAETGKVPETPADAPEVSPYRDLAPTDVSTVAQRLLSAAKLRDIVVKSLPPHLRRWER